MVYENRITFPPIFPLPSKIGHEIYTKYENVLALLQVE